MKLKPRTITRTAVTVAVGAHGNDVALQGVMREPDVGSWFDPLVLSLHEEAIASDLDEVVLDLRGLEYANAAVWRCFVLWVRLVRQDAKAHYNLRILSEPKHRWQEVGMSALRVFGADRLVVE